MIYKKVDRVTKLEHKLERLTKRHNRLELKYFAWRNYFELKKKRYQKKYEAKLANNSDFQRLNKRFDRFKFKNLK